MIYDDKRLFLFDEKRDCCCSFVDHDRFGECDIGYQGYVYDARKQKKDKY